ncbi:hypothetical protein HDU85_003184 [Gaertneriomyces sp. JEL0708]|nr:hypothetical protein HDU85_003184 [Gaertneriomyces sp. JEL0708]
MSAPRLVRYTSVISPALDRALFIGIGLAGYLLHERESNIPQDEQLWTLVKNKVQRMKPVKKDDDDVLTEEKI